MKHRKCETEGCDNEAKKSKLCHACYMRAYYATKRGVGWIMRRRATLFVWANTLRNLNTGNVARIKKAS